MNKQFWTCCRCGHLEICMFYLQNLLECQFDYNLKFKETINGQSAEEMRLLPIGRDKEGQAYWYFLVSMSSVQS